MNSIAMITAMVFGLGLRHGLDLDHLATIDAMARTLKNRPRLAKRAGILFSFGHGMIVLAVSLLFCFGALKAVVPAWFEPLGQGISLFFLFAFGLLTAYNSLFESAEGVVFGGLKQHCFQLFFKDRLNALSIMGIGALFALSFDTISQVAFFSLAYQVQAGWGFVFALALLFMLGMMTSDGINGFLIARIIKGAERRSLFLSRGLGLSIAAFSLYLSIRSLSVYIFHLQRSAI